MDRIERKRLRKDISSVEKKLRKVLMELQKEKEVDDNEIRGRIEGLAYELINIYETRR